MDESLATSLTIYISTALALLVIIVRVAFRRWRKQTLTWDDCIVLCAFPLYLTATIFYPLIILNGTNAVDFEIVQGLSQAAVDRRVLGSQLLYSTRPLYLTYMWLMKLCVLIYYTRLIPKETELLFIEWTGVLLIPAWIGCMLAIFLGCRPFSASFDLLPTPSTLCTSAFISTAVVSSLSIFFSLILMLLPLPIIVRARFTARCKIQICLMFLLGLFTMATSMVAICLAIQTSVNHRLTLLWPQVECFLMTIIASAPVIRDPLLRPSSTASAGSLEEAPAPPFQKQSTLSVVHESPAVSKQEHPDTSSAAQSLRSFSQIPIPSNDMDLEWQFLHSPFPSRPSSRTPSQPLSPAPSRHLSASSLARRPSLTRVPSLRRMPSLNRRGSVSQRPSTGESAIQPFEISRTVEVSQETHRLESELGELDEMLARKGEVRTHIQSQLSRNLRSGRISPWRDNRSREERDREARSEGERSPRTPVGWESGAGSEAAAADSVEERLGLQPSP